MDDYKKKLDIKKINKLFCKNLIIINFHILNKYYKYKEYKITINLNEKQLILIYIMINIKYY